MDSIRPIKFSATFPPFIPDQIFYERYLPFVQAHKDILSDVYVTIRIPPFVGDAMGVPLSNQQLDRALGLAFELQEKTGVPISGTFNNKFISPNKDNFHTFVENLKPLYERGLRNVTIPFTSWMYLGLKKHFPKLFVKNTVLQQLSRAADFYKAAEAGFDYLNLDRNLMRNFDQLAEIRRAVDLFQERHGRQVKLSLLWNEHCLGQCPFRDDHYNFNSCNSTNKSQQKSAADPVSILSLPQLTHVDERRPDNYYADMHEASCIPQLAASPSVPLRYANLISDRDYLKELTAYVDIFKLHGRSSEKLFVHSMNILAWWKAPEDAYLPDIFDEHFFIRYAVPRAKKAAWAKYIRNCKFDCWKCQVCDNLAKEHFDAAKSPGAPGAAPVLMSQIGLIPTSALDDPDLLKKLTTPPPGAAGKPGPNGAPPNAPAAAPMGGAGAARFGEVRPLVPPPAAAPMGTRPGPAARPAVRPAAAAAPAAPRVRRLPKPMPRPTPLALRPDPVNSRPVADLHHQTDSTESHGRSPVVTLEQR